MLAGEILRQAAARFGDKPALIAGSERLSFSELDRQADACAAALAERGLTQGSRVAILAPNIAAFPVFYWGAARAGLVVVSVSTRATPADITYMLAKVRAELVVFASDFAPLAAAARPSLPRVQDWIAVGPATTGSENFQSLLRRGSGVSFARTLLPDDPLAITFTGGTTGFPKAVLASHRARHISALTVASDFGLEAERDVVIVTTPLFHVAGMFAWLQPALMMGCTCVLQAGWNAERFMALVEEHGVTAALLVPTQIADLLDCPGFSAARLRMLRHLNYAAAPMPPVLYERLRAALPDAELIENYGQSETGPLSVRRGHHPAEKLGTVGRLASNLEIKIFDPQGREAPAGTLGEVVVRGPNLLTAYDGDPEETARLYKTGDGWLWTGDLARLDEDGFLTLVDRSKDMIISGGENIYPTELENALHRHPAVAECAVFGIPDERWGEVPAACVVLRAGASVTPETLIEFVAGAVARFKRPRAIEIVEALPRTAVGKIQKNELRADYRRKHGAAP